MNKWIYAVYDTATKVAKKISMGKGLTIEKVFTALKPNEYLIRTHFRNPKRRDKFVGDLKLRDWSPL